LRRVDYKSDFVFLKDYVSYIKILKIFAIGFFAFSLVYSTSFGLKESVDLFGRINSVDLVLNDIWIEPKNPKNGEQVSIHGSLYNSGIIPLHEVSQIATVGYIVNGELEKIQILGNIFPGIENGVEISSGPILDAVSGDYIVTVIIDYHDTLSHLRDNLDNNIIQKKFQISNETPSLIKYDIYQKYDNKINKQQITIQGELTDIFQGQLSDQKIILNIDGIKRAINTDKNGKFLFKNSIPYSDEPIIVSVHVKDRSSFPKYSQKILPLKMSDEQSALIIHTTSLSKAFENSALMLVIFQDSYDNLFKKISTNKIDDQSMQIDNSFLTILPANHEYFVEAYLNGRFLDGFQEEFTENIIIKKEIFISESAEIQFRVLNEIGEPQSNVIVNNSIYSAITDEYGFTDWIKVLPTVIANEPYAANATFSDGPVSWSDSFHIKSGEKKTIEIIQKVSEE